MIHRRPPCSCYKSSKNSRLPQFTDCACVRLQEWKTFLKSSKNMMLYVIWQITIFHFLFVLFYSILESPCSSLPCYNGGNCTEVGDSFVCKCACGYKGKQCEMKGIRITSWNWKIMNMILKRLDFHQTNLMAPLRKHLVKCYF
jgi:hypothetical protein